MPPNFRRICSRHCSAAAASAAAHRRLRAANVHQAALSHGTAGRHVALVSRTLLSRRCAADAWVRQCEPLARLGAAVAEAEAVAAGYDVAAAVAAAAAAAVGTAATVSGHAWGAILLLHRLAARRCSGGSRVCVMRLLVFGTVPTAGAGSGAALLFHSGYSSPAAGPCALLPASGRLRHMCFWLPATACLKIARVFFNACIVGRYCCQQ